MQSIAIKFTNGCRSKLSLLFLARHPHPYCSDTLDRSSKAMALKLTENCCNFDRKPSIPIGD